jgi:hypothetical protein
MFHDALRNGLEVVAVARPWSPLVALRLCVRVGSAHERPDEHGLAHVLEHVLLHRRFAAGYLADAWTTRDTTVFGATVPRADAEGTARALVGTVLRLDADDAVLRRELSMIAEERAHRENDPRWRLRERLLATLWEGTPYAHPILGDPAVLDGLTCERLGRFHGRWYQPANAVLLVVGDTAGYHVARRLCRTYTEPCAGSPTPEGQPDPPRPATSAALAAVDGPGPAVTAGVALPGGADAVEVLAHRIVTAATGLAVRRTRVRGGGATLLTRGGPAPAQALAELVGLLGTAEERVSGRLGAFLLTQARVVELRDAERLDAVAMRVTERWVGARCGYDGDRWYDRLMAVGLTDVLRTVAHLRRACADLAARAAPPPVPGPDR